MTWAIPIALSLVFVGLFTSANSLLEQWLEGAMRWIDRTSANLGQWLKPTRLMFWFVGAAVIWGLFRLPRRWLRAGQANGFRVHAITVRASEPSLEKPGCQGVAGFSGGAGVSVCLAVRCLVLFNLVFGLQSLMDLGYLWGGVALPEGMTYAQYAHRGAYPLVVTALLTGGLVLIGFRPGGPAMTSAWARRLVCLFVAQNLLLLVSSGMRLSLYVEVYSLTRLRVAAGVWMLLVLSGFAWVLGRIVMNRSNAWLVHRVLLTALLVFYATTFIDFTGAIAGYNARHCQQVAGQGVDLDVQYVASLGTGALPAVRWLRRQPIDARFDQALLALERDLADQLQTQTRNWRGWTWRRALALETKDSTDD